MVGPWRWLGFGMWLASSCFWVLGCLAPTLTVFDLVIMIMGQLASFGLP